MQHIAHQYNIPVGLEWRSNSCGYDFVLTIFYNVWKEDPNLRLKQFHSGNMGHHYLLNETFMDILQQKLDFHEAWEMLRYALHSYSSLEFTYGRQISVHTLLLHLLEPTSDILSSKLSCPLRHPLADSRPQTTSNSCISILSSHFDLQEYVNNMYTQVHRRCPTSACKLIQNQKFIKAPLIISFDLTNYQPKITDTLQISTMESSAKYYL